MHSGRFSICDVGRDGVCARLTGKHRIGAILPANPVFGVLYTVSSVAFFVEGPGVDFGNFLSGDVGRDGG